MSVNGSFIKGFKLSAWHSRNLLPFQVAQTSQFFISYNQKNSNKADTRTCEILATLVPFNTGALIYLFSTVGVFLPVLN